MRSLILLLTLACATATATAPCLDAADEPHHEVILNNERVRVLGLTLPRLGETKFFCHKAPYFIFPTTDGSATTEAEGEAPRTRNYSAGLAFFSYQLKPMRVRNEGGSLYKVIYVEVLTPFDRTLNELSEFHNDIFGAAPPEESTGATYNSIARGSVAAYRINLQREASFTVKQPTQVVIAYEDVQVTHGRTGSEPDTLSLRRGETSVLDGGPRVYENRGRETARFIVVGF